MKCRRFRVAVVCLCLAYGSGCSIATPYLKPTKTSAGRVVWSENRPEYGVEYCQRLAVNADATSQKELAAGIILGLIASGLAIAGAAMGPGASDAWVDRNRNALALGLGGILAVPTTIVLMRSKDASRASAAAGRGMALEDGEAMKECLRVRGDWAGARAEAAEYAKSGFTDRIKALQELKEKSEEEARTKRKEADALDPTKVDEKNRLSEEAADAEERARALGFRITEELKTRSETSSAAVRAAGHSACGPPEGSLPRVPRAGRGAADPDRGAPRHHGRIWKQGHTSQPP